MKKASILFSVFLLLFSFCACTQSTQDYDILTTTKPVYDFTRQLCSGTNLSVGILISEQVSCLHDYTLQVTQMRAIEAADTIVISGAGLENFMQELFPEPSQIIDASANIKLFCSDAHDHIEHEDHHHAQDPHIWMSIDNARKMAQNIFDGLLQKYPQYKSVFQKNLDILSDEFDTLDELVVSELSSLSHDKLITFHDGFAYFANYLDLHILKAIEEEPGSETSALELKEIIQLVEENQLPAIFTEVNGSNSAAKIIANETGANIFVLSTCMSHNDYFSAMRNNIYTIKEALG